MRFCINVHYLSIYFRKHDFPVGALKFGHIQTLYHEEAVLHNLCVTTLQTIL